MFFDSVGGLVNKGKAFVFFLIVFQLLSGLPASLASLQDVTLVDNEPTTPKKRRVSPAADKENNPNLANINHSLADERTPLKKQKSKLRSLVAKPQSPDDPIDLSTIQSNNMAVEEKAEKETKILPFLKLTDEEKATFVNEGWTELEILTFEYLNSLLYRPEKYFTEDELKAYAAKGGDIMELEEAMISINQHYPHAIVNPTTIAKKWFSPSARLAKNPSRPEISSLKARKLVYPVDADYAKEPEPVETDEERLARKKKLALLFEASEVKRGVTADQTEADLVWEINLWNKSYFPYMEKLREAAQTQPKSKIKRGDIEDVFQMFIAPHYKSFQYKGYTVYYNEELIDLGRQDKDGKSNEVNLSRGKCPIGVDGKSMNFHHLTHHDPGLIVVLNESFHEKSSGLLHFAKSIYHRPKAVKRNAFNDIREHLCIELAKVLTVQKRQ